MHAAGAVADLQQDRRTHRMMSLAHVEPSMRVRFWIARPDLPASGIKQGGRIAANQAIDLGGYMIQGTHPESRTEEIRILCHGPRSYFNGEFISEARRVRRSAHREVVSRTTPRRPRREDWLSHRPSSGRASDDRPARGSAPVEGSTMMELAIPQVADRPPRVAHRREGRPRAPRARRPPSRSKRSGNHWWWVRGASTAASRREAELQHVEHDPERGVGDRPAARRARSRARTLPSVQDDGRRHRAEHPLPRRDQVGLRCRSGPAVSVRPGIRLKSPISLFSRKPGAGDHGLGAVAVLQGVGQGDRVARRVDRREMRRVVGLRRQDRERGQRRARRGPIADRPGQLLGRRPSRSARPPARPRSRDRPAASARVKIGPPHRLGDPVHGARRLRAVRLEVEPFQDVEHLAEDDAARGGRAPCRRRRGRGTAVRTRRPELGLVGGEVVRA